MKFNEQDIEQIEAEKAQEDKEIKKCIKWLTTTIAKNYDTRVEFATKIFQLSLSSNNDARKLTKKISQFLFFYGKDFYISEDEWRKLNNTDSLEESVELKEDVPNYRFNR